MRCSRCGNENPASNRFCGMCGTTLVPAPAPGAGALPSAGPERPADQTSARQSGMTAASVPSRGAAPQRPAELNATRAAEPVSEPVISGPSFLGLNQPAGGSRSSGRDSLLQTSFRSVDYLLEDDEPRHGGGKFILIVIALALAVGFGYLRWRNGGLEWLTSGAKKVLSSSSRTENSQPAANSNPDNSGATNPSAENSGAPGGGPPANTPGTRANNAGGTPPPAGAQPGAGAGDAANASAAAGNGNAEVAPAGSGSGAAQPGDAGAGPAGAKGSSGDPSRANASANSEDAGERTAPVKNSSAKEDSSVKTQNDDAQGDEEGEPDNSSGDVPTPRGKSSKEAAAPLSKPHAATPVEVVTAAEKYIYGRGVAQDCDRGLKMLRPAAEQANPKAMISLGALYSAGLCAPRDLPTAYRWFALALRKEPDNNSVQTDLQKLWSEMTQPERQLAIKLSQ